MGKDKIGPPPVPVRNAVTLLWFWIAQLVAFGIYQARDDTATMIQAMAPLQAAFPALNLSPHAIYLTTLIGNMLIPLTMCGVVYRTGRGKNWARGTILVSFLLDLVYSIFCGHSGILDYGGMVIDLGLQMGALWLLFTNPGKHWFA